MIQLVCCVFDRGIASYLRPFTVPHTAHAIRALQSELRQEGSEFRRHPQDYDLYQVAEFDDQTGSFSSMVPVLVVRVQDLIVQE